MHDRMDGQEFHLSHEFLAAMLGVRRQSVSVHRTLERVGAEFLEMPGLRLTLKQVERLCGVDQTICKTVLDALVEAKFLQVGADGMYTRLSDGALLRPRPANVEHASPARASQRHA